MPDYKTGTYLLKCKKTWACTDCSATLTPGSIVFTRVVCYGDEKVNQKKQIYQHKNYTRFCLDCAMARPDLTDGERLLLAEIAKEKILEPQTEEKKVEQIT